MKKNKIIFIGYTRYGLEPNCGVTVKNQTLIERFKELNFNVVIIDSYHFKKHFWRGFKFIYHVLFTLSARIVISENPPLSDWLVRFFYYLNFHRNVYHFVMGGNLHTFMNEGKFKPKYYKYLNSIMVETQTVAEGLNRLELHNAIRVRNPKKFSYLPHKKFSNNNTISFVFLSRIVPKKGINNIINSVIRLNELNYSNRFVVDIFGPFFSDNYENEFKLQIKDISNLNYCGFLNMNEMNSFDQLATYDVMLFPTEFDTEGIPGSIVDAYIAGIPVIATEWPVSKDVINDGITGIIIPMHDKDALFLTMRDVIERKYDLKKMSENCQKEALKYKTDNVLSIEFLNDIQII